MQWVPCRAACARVLPVSVHFWTHRQFGVGHTGPTVEHKGVGQTDTSFEGGHVAVDAYAVVRCRADAVDVHHRLFTAI